MKKKIFLLLLIPIVLFTLTGCNEKKNNTTKKDVKTITLKDEKLGYKTTFTYDKKDNYSAVKENTGGASTEIEFDNEEKDVEFQMYYNKTSVNSYETAKENRSKQKYYKEYKFGKYTGYAYGEYSSGLYLIIKLGEEDNMADLLFVSIDRMDSNEDVIVSDVLEKDLKDFFNSIKFEKTK